MDCAPSSVLAVGAVGVGQLVEKSARFLAGEQSHFVLSGSVAEVVGELGATESLAPRVRLDRRELTARESIFGA